MRRILLFLSTSLVLSTLLLCNAADYPPLLLVWNVSLGGDMLRIHDLEGDGDGDLVVGLFNGASSYVYLLDESGDLVWRNKVSIIWPENRPRVVDVVDVEGDVIPDILIASEVKASECVSSRSPYRHYLFRVSRVEDPVMCGGNPACNFNEWAKHEYGYLLDFEVADVNSDGVKDVVAGARDFNVIAVSGSDGSLIWSYAAEGSVNAIEAADLTGDGKPEVLAGSYRYLHALSSKGSLKWKYDAQDKIIDVKAGDITGDGVKEVMFLTSWGGLSVLDYTGNLLWNTSLFLPRESISHGKIDGLNEGEVLTLKGNTIHAYNESGDLEWSFNTGALVLQAATFDATGDGLDEVFILNKRRLSMYTLNWDYVNDTLADRHYMKALSLYNKSKWGQATSEATRAWKIYKGLGDYVMVNYTLKLINHSLTHIEVDETWGEAKKAYAAGEFKKTINYSTQAYRLFLFLNHSSKVNETENLASKASMQIDANNLLFRAQEYFRAGVFTDGIIYADKAADTYLSADNVLDYERALKLANSSLLYRTANSNYSSAYKHYKLGEFYEARRQVLASKEIYDSTGDEAKIAQAENLEEKILKSIHVMETSRKIQKKIAEAKKNFNLTKYPQCLSQAEDALSEINLLEGVNLSVERWEAQNLKTLCGKGVSATKSYARAVEYYSRGEYDVSADYVIQARDIYRSIGDWQNTIRCDELLLDIRSINEEDSPLDAINPVILWSSVFIITFLVLILAFIAIFVIREEKWKIKRILQKYRDTQKTMEDEDKALRMLDDEQDILPDTQKKQQPEETPTETPPAMEKPTLKHAGETLPAKKESDDHTHFGEQLGMLANQLEKQISPPEKQKKPEKKEPETNPQDQEHLEELDRIRKQLKDIDDKLNGT
ncbi:MAG: PQQ-binding-like beta-propeller repeat protein [Candidatus Altiarchaeales archaeon]|nr:PQQ-binding-like beta-propeller repeat protein [Candidatus Altiarchaeales archaeon]